MKPDETQSARAYSYTKALDGRKQPIRGLWKRGNRFYGRMRVETRNGGTVVKRIMLSAGTVAKAREELDRLKLDRSQGKRPPVSKSPAFATFLDEIYLPRLLLSGKKPRSIASERSHLKAWRASLGQTMLKRIRPDQVSAHLVAMKARGLSGRSRNLALVHLRNVLKAAKVSGLVGDLSAVEGIEWETVTSKERRLFTISELDRLCAAAFGTRTNEQDEVVPVTKNAQQFVDFIRLLCYCGAREQEAIKLSWGDVDFEGRKLTIGSDGDTKNREARRVFFNPDLEAHLRDMFARRVPDSQWLFPSPQRGERDERARSFRESLKLVRAAADMETFAFHDCRHHFISMSVMAGIDYMSIARWVGHKDGGVLIGKVYGHLSSEHQEKMAAKLSFTPVVVKEAVG